MDGLLNELQQSGVGCHMGKVFAGAFAYADDIILLSPSVQALNTLLFICNDYASRSVFQLGLFLRALRPARTGLRPARFTRALPEFKKKKKIKKKKLILFYFYKM